MKMFVFVEENNCTKVTNKLEARCFLELLQEDILNVRLFHKQKQT